MNLSCGLSADIHVRSLRVQQQNKTAEELAKVLLKHPCIEKVHYPTVRYHRDYEVANRPGMFPCGFGGVISFEVKGDGNPWSQETFDATARSATRQRALTLAPHTRVLHACRKWLFGIRSTLSRFYLMICAKGGCRDVHFLFLFQLFFSAPSRLRCTHCCVETLTVLGTGRFIDALRIPYIGPSLGGVESLVEQVRVVGYYDQPLEVRQKLSITNGLVRFACGIEDTQDIIDDVVQALEDVPLDMTVAQMREAQTEPIKGDVDDGNRAWMRKTIKELPNLRAPITVQAENTCREAIRLMQSHGIDQVHIATYASCTQPFRIHFFPKMVPLHPTLISEHT